MTRTVTTVRPNATEPPTVKTPLLAAPKNLSHPLPNRYSSISASQSMNSNYGPRVVPPTSRANPTVTNNMPHANSPQPVFKPTVVAQPRKYTYVPTPDLHGASRAKEADGRQRDALWENRRKEEAVEAKKLLERKTGALKRVADEAWKKQEEARRKLEKARKNEELKKQDERAREAEEKKRLEREDQPRVTAPKTSANLVNKKSEEEERIADEQRKKQEAEMNKQEAERKKQEAERIRQEIILKKEKRQEHVTKRLAEMREEEIRRERDEERRKLLKAQTLQRTETESEEDD
ncbi:hypothetical protein RUND412_008628 [Rhizina undulata]